MAFVIADRVRETTESTGTGVLILDGAPEGFQRFTDGIGSGNTCPYTIVDLRTGDWESGRGTFQVGAQNHTLQRDTVTDSSNLGSKVDFESGEKEVFSNFISDIAIVSGAQIDMDDDVKFALGDDEDYWFVYDSSGTQFRLRSTDTDGGGADGDIFTVQDGGDVLDFSSAPTVGGTAVSLVGHSHAASDVTSGTFADARLSANVALLDAVQTFSADKAFGDDVAVQFGAAPDYWIEYESANTRLRLRSSDVDGVGTDGDLLRVPDGRQMLDVQGDILFAGTGFRSRVEAIAMMAVEDLEDELKEVTAGFGSARRLGVNTDAYSITNDVADRTFDANATTTAELADVLATLIRDLGRDS